MTDVKDDEINLLDLLAGIVAAFKQNLVLTISVPLLGAAVMLSTVINKPDRFQSSLLIETSLLTEVESHFLFDELNRAGIIPGLSAEEDQQIEKFEVDVRLNNRGTDGQPESSLNERSVQIEVKATVFSTDVFPALENAIVNFVDTSPAVVRHRKEREQYYSRIISQITRELQSMEEVKQQVASNNRVPLLDPSALYVTSVSLLKEKVEYQIKLEEINKVHLIKGFDSLTAVNRPNLMMAMAIGFAVGVVVLAVILFLKFFIGYFARYERRTS